MIDNETRIEFVTEEGVCVDMTQDDHGHIVVRLSTGGDAAIVTFYLVPQDAQAFINGLVVTNQSPVAGAWGSRNGLPIHIPSYNQGHADALGGVE